MFQFSVQDSSSCEIGLNVVVMEGETETETERERERVSIQNISCFLSIYFSHNTLINSSKLMEGYHCCQMKQIALSPSFFLRPYFIKRD